ncbi:MAG: DUF4384 domain-containing protein [Acidobacteriota bacterium]
MKNQFKTSILLLIIAGLISLPVFGQGGKKFKADGVNTRGIKIRQDVTDNKVDGLTVSIYQVQNVADQNPRLVDPRDVFKEGDRIRISLTSNFDGFVYVVNIDPSGKKYLSYPSQDAQNNYNEVKAGQPLFIPPQNTLDFDNVKGTEVLQIIVSKERIAYYEEGYKMWKSGEIPNTKEAAAKELAGNFSSRGGVVKSENVSIPRPLGGKILARKIDLAPPDKNNKDAVVAIPQDTKNNGKMNDQPVAFEIRLQHN